MALTVRTTEQDDIMINTAAKQLGTKTGTKTLLVACDQFLKQRNEILQLTQEVNRLREKLDERTEVMDDFKQSFQTLMEFE
ncbi:hypothetical protein [Agarivorans litoreus]|uniref:hypothetical protein n=1 Tax=Agarivorans litoreus TaxID=1510455 RepID=UPI001C7DA76C|nr:hypothetical protein [Agarivorans litoreus]